MLVILPTLNLRSETPCTVFVAIWPNIECGTVQHISMSLQQRPTAVVATYSTMVFMAKISIYLICSPVYLHTSVHSWWTRSKDTLWNSPSLLLILVKVLIQSEARLFKQARLHEPDHAIVGGKNTPCKILHDIDKNFNHKSAPIHATTPQLPLSITKNLYSIC